MVEVPVAIEVPAVRVRRSSGSRRHEGECAAVTMMMILGWWERTQEEALGDLFVWGVGLVY